MALLTLLLCPALALLAPRYRFAAVCRAYVQFMTYGKQVQIIPYRNAAMRWDLWNWHGTNVHYSGTEGRVHCSELVVGNGDAMGSSVEGRRGRMVHVNGRELLFDHRRHAARGRRSGEQGRRVRLRRVRYLEVRARGGWVPRRRASRHGDGFRPFGSRGRHGLRRFRPDRRPLSPGVARRGALRALHVGSH